MSFLGLHFHQTMIKVQILFSFVKVLCQNPNGQHKHQHYMTMTMELHKDLLIKTVTQKG